MILTSIIIALIIYALVLIWLIYTRGKGAEYAPTTSKRARKMIEFGKITKKDVVYDLGSGFGGLALKAAENAKQVKGIEYDLIRYLTSKIRAKIKGVKNIQFIRGDLFNLDINDADVVFLFLKQRTNQMLKSKMKKLKKGTRIVTNMWTFEGWNPIKKDWEKGIYLYIIGKSDVD